MDKDQNDVLNTQDDVQENAAADVQSAAQDVQEDISAKVAEAAAEIQDEIDSTPAYDTAKPKKGVTISIGALIGIIAAFVIVAVAIAVPTVNYVNNLPKYGKAEGKTVATVNGEKITDEDMGYYIYAAAYTLYYEVEGEDADGDLEGYDWDQDYEGRKLSDIVKENAYNNAVGDMVTSQKIDEILTGDDAWTESDDSQIESTVDAYVEQFGEDGFALRAKSMGISTANEYARIYSLVVKSQTIQSYVEEDGVDAYTPDGVDLGDYKDDTYCTAKHILLTVEEADETADAAADETADTTDAGYDDATALALAEQIYEQLMEGEDFDTLMETYNDDTGETTEGYTFTTGEMVEEFEDAAFALDIDEISEPVRSDYGYHIIQRIAGFYDLRNYWISQAKVSLKQSTYDNISVQGIMDGVWQSGEELNAESDAD